MNDDLIYALTIALDEPCTIVSSDKDFLQVPYLNPKVQVYDPLTATMRPTPTFDWAIYKCLIGDKSDKVPGYSGIGPVNGERLARSEEAREEFLAQIGRTTYDLNRILLDLTQNPHLQENVDYVKADAHKAKSFDLQGLRSVAAKHKLIGFETEFHRAIAPFKRLRRDQCTST
jgi:5'-3' exonuclease